MLLLSGAAVVGTGAAVAGGTLGPGLGAGPGPDAAMLSAAAAAVDVADLADLPDLPAAHSGATSVDGPSTLAAGLGSADPAAAESPLTAPAARTGEPVTTPSVRETARRSVPVSRSDRRGAFDPRKQAALALEPGSNAMTRVEDSSDADPRTIAAALLGDAAQFGCLDSLWTRESGWRVNADNPSSSAYGIPQALPGSKMSSFGADWATNPVTQIRWGLSYIEDRYGSPCGAWGHSQSYGWY